MRKITYLTLLIGSFWVSDSEALEVDYETTICRDCSYSQAVQKAENMEPSLNCYVDGMGPEDQSCYSQTNYALIVNYTTKEKFAFRVGHRRQGVPPENMGLYVEDIAVQPGLDDLVDAMLERYDALSRFISDKNEDWHNLSAAYSTYSSESNDCSYNSSYRALKWAFNARVRTGIRDYFQNKIDSSPDFRDSFVSSRITSTGFNFSKGGFGIQGGWEYIDDNKTLHRDFNGSSNPSGNKNEVYWNVSVASNSNSVDIRLDFHRSRFDGYSLLDIKNAGEHVSNMDQCLGVALDEVFPKLISSGGSSGGSGGSSGGSGGSGAPGWGRIPITSGSGKAGGGSVQTCLHHYYRNGQLLVSIGGPCP